MVYSICAIMAIGVLLYRRKAVGGEFGGPAGLKWGSSLFFVFLWCCYIAISAWISIDADENRKDIKVYGGLGALCLSDAHLAHALNTPQ